jgi:hypothetical protein
MIVMNKIKNIAAISATALLMTGAAVTTASAQPWRDHGPRYESSSRLTSGYVDSLEWRINEAARNRAISWGEARQLLGQLRQVQPLAYRVETGQASQWEHRRLSNVVSRIERSTQGYAYNDRRERYGYNDRRY